MADGLDYLITHPDVELVRCDSSPNFAPRRNVVIEFMGMGRAAMDMHSYHDYVELTVSRVMLR